MKNILHISLLILTVCTISCKKAPNNHFSSVNVTEGDMQNTYVFEYDSALRLKSWEADYNDMVHGTVLTKFVYKENAIEIFKRVGEHRKDGTRYNMSPYELDCIIKMDSWKPMEILDPQNQRALFKFFYKEDLISSAVYYDYRYGRDSMVYELDKKGNIVREFRYHTNYLKQYEPRPDMIVYQFDNNPNPWYKFIGNVNNGCFLPASAKSNNYSFRFDPSTFFSPNNINYFKEYKDMKFTYTYNEDNLPNSITIEDRITLIKYLSDNKVSSNNILQAEDEKLKAENTMDLSVFKTSLLRASINKCKQELGSPDMDGMIREFDDGNVYIWIYLNRNVHSENVNKQHLVVFIKALGHGRGIVEDIQTINDNEKVYYDYGNLYAIVRNGGKDIESNSRSFHSTSERNN
jgi:hypothetical protein